MSFVDKVIWITGASSGIGEALAYEFSRYGARLVLSARRQDELERVKAACVWPDNHLVLPMDLANPAEMDIRIAQVMDHFGRIDILVNNGGISQRSYIRDTDLAVDRKIMEVDYFGTLALTKGVLPHMTQAGGGDIVVVSSVAGLISTPLRAAYCAAKHALHGFFEALRAEYAEEGIHVLMVCPGAIRTQVSVNALSGDGSPHGEMDALQREGIPVEQCALEIVAGLQKRRNQIIIARKEKLAVYLYRFLPSLYRFLIRKIKVT